MWGPQGVCDSEHGACAGGRTCNVVLVRKGRDGDGVSRSNKEYAFVYFIQKHSLLFARKGKEVHSTANRAHRESQREGKRERKGAREWRAGEMSMRAKRAGISPPTPPLDETPRATHVGCEAIFVLLSYGALDGGGA